MTKTSKANSPAPLWIGRFSKGLHPLAAKFSASIQFDKRLAPYDIQTSLAHVAGLAKAGVLKKAESQKLIRALKQLGREIDRDKIVFDPALEDIHMNIEGLITKKLGRLGQKLQTGRSRNDQVATDLRLYLKDQIAQIQARLKNLQKILLGLAEENIEVVIPGYTHLQRAQPLLFSHHLLAYVAMLGRDFQRLQEVHQRTDVLPLGSAALAGTSYKIDRAGLARQLGFSGLSANSLDAVSDRDFVIEFLSAAAVVMMHLSRFCEELVLWSTSEFNFVEIGDDFTTGSSLMPQKKNPDIAELIRGKTGRVYGHLMALLTVMKGLPLSYNRDLQEDKEALFDSVDTVKDSLSVFSEMLRNIRVKSAVTNRAAGGVSLSTDLADYLVAKGLPFRQAHHLTGQIVSHCLKKGGSLTDLTIQEFKRFSKKINGDVYRALNIKSSLAKRDVAGGTAPRRVRQVIQQLKSALRIKKGRR